MRMARIPPIGSYISPDVGATPLRIPVACDGEQMSVQEAMCMGCRQRRGLLFNPVEEQSFLIGFHCSECERLTVLKVFRPAGQIPYACYYHGDVESNDRRLEDG